MATPDRHAWTDRSRIVLTPVAAPAVLGWFAFAIAALLVGSHLAGWWGGEQTLTYLAPFVLFLGAAQFLAAMWGFRAREPVATAVHGIWGGLWLGMGLAYGLAALDLLTLTGLEMPLGFLMLGVGIITLGVVAATLFENLVLALLAGLAAVAAGIGGIGLMAETTAMVETGGWLLVIAAAAGWYFGTAILLAEISGVQRLPIGRYRMAADVPGEPTIEAVAYSTGMPYLEVTAAGDGGERRHEPAS